MDFKENLNSYIELVGCTTGELSTASGLSAAAVSRYRSGARTPTAESEQLVKLAEGIAVLAGKTGHADVTCDALISEWNDLLNPRGDSGDFAAKVDYMIRELNLNVSAMARALSYDASFISRIRAGNRIPSDVAVFCRKFAYYVVRTCDAPDVLSLLGKAAGDDAGDDAGDERDSVPDAQQLAERLERFLLEDAPVPVPRTNSFLQKIDEFDLNEYIRSIRFDELKVPTAVFRFPISKEYFGVDGQKKGELEFLRGTVLSKSGEPVFMCSDMDMEDMAEDVEFSKNWMFGLAMILKKKLTINIVHNLNRPFSELMLGLEAWIPLYMTGQVVPLYIRGVHNTLYQHLLYVSGDYALSGEGIKGCHNQGRYVLTDNKSEWTYYDKRAQSILKKASPLMEIYTQEQAERFRDFYNASPDMNGNRHYISSFLPAFTLSGEALEPILRAGGVPEDRLRDLLDKNARRREILDGILEENKVLHEVPLIPEEEFARHPMLLDLSEYEYYTPIPYSYADYREHIKACEDYAVLHDNYIFKPNREFAFRNIQIRILEGKWVWITKIKSPMIHFVIYHPMLRDAIEKMYFPVWD